MKTRRQTLILAGFLAALYVAASLTLFFPARAAVVLEVGSSGANVTKVQKKLIQFGYLDGESDGRYGEKTRDAVKWFQRRNGLTVDGRVGPSTAAALGVTLSSSASSSGSSAVSADQYLLARLVYAEARGESYKGKVAVAAVVLNRVRSAAFPNTISGVIFQSGAFDCVADGQLWLTPDQDSIRAASDALAGWDPTSGCVYYYNPATATSSWIWSREVRLTIGAHAFAV